MTAKQRLIKKTKSGFRWTALDTLLAKGIPVVVMILIARFLGPEEFGLFGILVIIVSLGILMNENGFCSSLIQKSHLSRYDLDTVFYVNLLLNLGVYGLFALLAPLIAVFFHTPELSSLIRALALLFPIGTLSAVQTALLNKKLRFRKLAIVNSVAALSGGFTACLLALNGNGIWSVVWMYLIQQSISAAMLWFISPWKPGFRFSKVHARSHFRFGSPLLLSGILDTIFRNIYNIIIGRFYPIQTLAFFERARSFQEYPSMAITGIAAKVSYPVLSKMQTEPGWSEQFFKRLIQLGFFLNAPLMMILAGVATPLITLILGNAWLDSVPYFQILCLVSIFYPHHAFNLNLLKVNGRSDLFLRVEVVKKAMVLFIVVLSVPFGLKAMLWGMVINSVLALYINIYYTRGMSQYRFRDQLSDLLPDLFLALLSYGTCTLICQGLSYWTPLPLLLLSSASGLLVYIGLKMVFFKTQALHQLSALIHS